MSSRRVSKPGGPPKESLRKLEQEMEDAVRIFPFQQFDSVTQVQLEHPISAEPIDDGLFVTPCCNCNLISICL